VGITGKQQSLTSDAAALVKRIRRWTGPAGKGLPVAVGFGISNAEHVAQVAEFADAAIVGSAIVELIERATSENGPETAPAAVSRFIKGLRLPQTALAR
jgi:tryptophan synthase alpha chain